MMSAALTSSPANQDRPLLIHPSSQPSDNQRRIRTLLDLLTVEKMDGGDRITLRQGEENNNNNNNNNSKWKILKERLGLKLIGCCGVATWQFENSSPPEEDNDEDVVVLEETNNNNNNINNNNINNNDDDVEVVVGPTRGMNLGAALAAEREFRAGESRGSYGEEERVRRVSLMRLLEERMDSCDMEKERGMKGEDEENGRTDRVCCVCMERKKGAAFIPCGHTYCRVCSRELWLNRGSCPLCNRPILEILDIF